MVSRPAPPAPATQDGRTPLLWAARYGHKDVAALLLERGADKEAKDNVSVPMHAGPAATLPHKSVDMVKRPLTHVRIWSHLYPHFLTCGPTP